MNDRYQRLRDALAAGPTPGPWRIGTPPPNGEQTIGTRQGLMLAVATTGMEAETLANATYIAAADPDTIAALLAERDALRKLVAAGCLLSSESEEVESDDGMERCAGLDYWIEFEKKLAEARLLIEGGERMRPASSMLSSTDPDDKTCEAKFTAGPLSFTTRITNVQFFGVSRLLEHAYEAGRRDGRLKLGQEIERVIEGYDK